MRIYLDHAATSPLRPEAAEAMQQAVRLCGNPSSSHFDGRAAAQVLEQHHDRVASILACKHDDVVFNSGGSEGDAHALLGAAELLNSLRFGQNSCGVAKRPLRLAASAVEHKAVLHSVDKLTAFGHESYPIPVDANGVIELDCLRQRLKSPGLDLVSIMLVNNETGVIQPVETIARLCAAHGTLFHCDAVQAPGHGLSSLLQLPAIPLLTLTAHKFGGPRGIGVLIQRRALIGEILDQPAPVSLPALICGGQQEHGCRAGTENIHGIAGLTAALSLAERQSASQSQLRAIQTRLESDLLNSRKCAVTIHGSMASRSPHITSIAFYGILGRDLQDKLDRAGISVGLGSACTSCDRKVSHVLRAMNVTDDFAQSTIRISLADSTSSVEVSALVNELRSQL